MRANETVEMRRARLKSPRAAAVAGIIFAVLFTASNVLIRLALPDPTNETVVELEQSEATISLALALFPFAGIAFLLFIASAPERDTTFAALHSIMAIFHVVKQIEARIRACVICEQFNQNLFEFVKIRICSNSKKSEFVRIRKSAHLGRRLDRGRCPCRFQARLLAQAT